MDAGEGSERYERGPERRRRVRGGRKHRHSVRVTPEEEAMLLALAMRHGVSVSKLLVDSALSGSAAEAGAANADRRDLAIQLLKVNRLLSNVANNLNQMTKVLHSTGELPPQTGEVLDAVRKTVLRVEGLLDRLKP